MLNPNASEDVAIKEGDIGKLINDLDSELNQLEMSFGKTPAPADSNVKPEPKADSASQSPGETHEVTPPKQDGQSNAIEIDGQKYSIDDIKSWKENVATTEQLKEWQAKLTKEQQSLTSKKRDIRQQIADLKTEVYDEDKQKMLELLEAQSEQIEQQQKMFDQLAEEREYNEAKNFVAQAKTDLESRYNTKLPDLDTPEFKEIVQLSQTGNRLEMAFLLWQKMKGKDNAPATEPKLDALDSIPSSTVDQDVELTPEMLAEAKRAGISAVDLKEAIKFGRDNTGFM